MSDSPLLDLAQRLWPSVRDTGVVADPEDLDRLIATQGVLGAIGQNCGLTSTFACFAPEQNAAAFVLPTGERPQEDAEGRFIAHALVTRVLLGAGLGIDPRVEAALCAGHALSWAASGLEYPQSPLALATALWLPALDPDSGSDRPLPIDWSAACFEDPSFWNPDERLFSHYDVRENALDWAVYASSRPERHQGVSIWTIVEPLLRMGRDSRAAIALSNFADSADPASTAPAPAAAMLERRRISDAMRAYFASAGSGGSGGARLAQ
jgi:hypothetical protein